ncbi:hypothetical protein [Mycobacterium nebraskense]|uniref:hypothetical protein n=1 Tax=Mycobacterium nebraskense TaxID=244292 RepID=UPI0023F4358A|nr:hypothetical protein [Mycobacterium nebraskense]MBI2692765.1 hypothetical protein [Mycobacterium nebraskense]
MAGQEKSPAPRRRGRPSRPERAEATGYRATEALRREIDVARGFTGIQSIQAFIDEAVRTYLLQLRDNMPNYRVAAEALDAELRGAASNVAALRPSRQAAPPKRSSS